VRISRKRLEGLVGFDEAVSVCQWQVAERYFVYGGEIQPDREAWWKWTMDKPLADPNLFLGFSHLGARGDDLPENAILRWVHRHGLLWLKDPNEDRLSIENQAPITLGEFREEARRAYEALTLLVAIRSENFDAIRPRIGRVRANPPGKLGTGGLVDVYLDGQPIPVALEADRELDGKDVRVAAIAGLEWFVKSRLRDVELDFDHFSGHPRPGEAYRPRLTVSIPDLHGAIWYQFACLMADTRPVKHCVVCDQPIPRPRKNRETCSDACRQAKHRRGS
jgi:hypothetical protein